jgi:hypothetical protein
MNLNSFLLRLIGNTSIAVFCLIQTSVLFENFAFAEAISVGPFYIDIQKAKDIKKEGVFDIQLLDQNQQNPVVKNSAVDIFVKIGNSESQMSCAVLNETQFRCQLDVKKPIKGELQISAKRSGLRAEEFKLQWPIGANKSK